MRERFCVILASLCFLFILAVAPRQVEADNSKKIALVMKSLSNPFFSKMEEGARQYAVANKIPLEVFGVDRETDIDMQIAIVEDLISRGYGALVIAPADSRRLVPVCEKAIKKGMKVINIDNPLHVTSLQKRSLMIPFVGSDNKVGASMVADYLKRRLNNKGKVVVLEGIRGVENADLRKKGFIETITRNSTIEVVASEIANWHADEAFSLTSRLLTEHPDIDAVFCANDSMALGTLQALEAAGLNGKVLIGAYDNIEEVRDAMRSGQIHATIEQHPELMGRFGVQLAWDVLRNKTVAVYHSTPLDLVTHDTFGQKVGLLISSLKNPFFTLLVNGARDAAELFGYDLEVYDADDDDAQQLSDMMTALAEKPEVVILNPVNSDTIFPGIEIANEQKIPVITIDRKSPGGIITSHIASDNFKGGVMAAKAMVEYLGGKGSIIEFEGTPSTSAAHDRGQGFNSVITAQKEIKISQRIIANFDRDTASKNMRQLISTNTHFDAIFAHNDNMILGVLDVLAETGYDKPVITIGFDALPEAIKAVAVGRLTATIGQQPQEMGWVGAREAARLLRGETLPEETLIKLKLIRYGIQ